MRHLDNRLFLDINSFARHTHWLHTPLLEYAKYGIVLFGALLVAGLVVGRAGPSRRLAAAGWACAATLIAVALNQPLVHLFSEARPYTKYPHALLLATPTADYSFPSDHATMAGAAAAGLFMISRSLGLLAAAAALLMAFARVYIGAHYPWDVLGGLLFGATVSTLGWVLLRRPLIALIRSVRARGWLRPLLGVDRQNATSR